MDIAVVVALTAFTTILCARQFVASIFATTDALGNGHLITRYTPVTMSKSAASFPFAVNFIS